ncbi:MAG: hypothetical protein AAGC46_09760 [Solirubrobacteraceae bacterium]|nr:hypothetical protein [Patulibacter sp.]
MPQSHPVRRALPALGLLALACAPSVATAAPAASPYAAPSAYEQISRADGPAGAAVPLTLTTPMPVFASDLGLSAAYTLGPSALQPNPVQGSTIVRNTLTNRSRDLGTGFGVLVKADRTETVGLFQKLIPGQGGSAWGVGPLDGRGPFRTLAVSQYAQVQLAGNGKFVIASDDQGLRRLNLATGVWTQIAPLGYIGANSVSDDGQTVASIDFDPVAQTIAAVLWQGTTRKLLVDDYPYSGPGTEPMISADGSTAFTAVRGGDYPAPTVLTTYKLRTGKSFATNVPFDKGYAVQPVWLAPDGSRVAWALGYQDRSQGVEPAKAFDTQSKTWSTFGGQFATSIVASNGIFQPTTAISRNGQFAAIGFNRQVALVNLSGGPLLGNLLGLENVSASSYLDTAGLDYCGFGSSSSFLGIYTQPADWIKPPRKAHITVSNGSTVLADADWTTPEPYPGTSLVPGGPVDLVDVSFPVGTPHTRTVKFSVTDGNGRKLAETYSQTVTCGG